MIRRGCRPEVCSASPEAPARLRSLRRPPWDLCLKRLVFALSAALLLPVAAESQTQLPIESASGLELHNVTAESVDYEGKRAVRITISEDAQRRIQGLPIEEQSELESLAVVEGTSFDNGVIEVEVAGAPAPGAEGGARGFVGIAFRVQPGARTYDAFYLRPTNARADDQVRRNHSVQYIAHPDWTWQRFRQEAPERYESYVDLVPGEWTQIRIEVRGERALLYVRDQEQPTLIVNDLKSGPDGKGAIALWIGPGTVAHFRDLTVSP